MKNIIELGRLNDGRKAYVNTEYNPVITVYGKTGSGKEVSYNKMLIQLARKYLSNGEIVFMDMKSSNLLAYKKTNKIIKHFI